MDFQNFFLFSEIPFIEKYLSRTCETFRSNIEKLLECSFCCCENNQIS